MKKIICCLVLLAMLAAGFVACSQPDKYAGDISDMEIINIGSRKIATVNLKEHQQRELLEILNRVEWRNGTYKITEDCVFKVGGTKLRYESQSGYIVDDAGNCFAGFSDEDTAKVNSIIFPRGWFN